MIKFMQYLIWVIITELNSLSTWLPRWLSGKESTCNVGNMGGFNPRVGKIPWRRKSQPTPKFLPGKFHGQEEPGGLQFIGSQWVWHDLGTKQQQIHYHWYYHNALNLNNKFSCFKKQQVERELTSSWSFWLLSRPSPSSAIQIHNKDSPWRSRKDFRQDCECVFFHGGREAGCRVLGVGGRRQIIPETALKRAHQEDWKVPLYSKRNLEIMFWLTQLELCN